MNGCLGVGENVSDVSFSLNYLFILTGIIIIIYEMGQSQFSVSNLLN